MEGTSNTPGQKIQVIDSEDKQVCFHCKKPLEKVVAYITRYMFPVCEECLPALCENYIWEADSLETRRINPKKMETMYSRTQEEIEHQVGSVLSMLPLLIEKEMRASEVILTKIVELSEIRELPILESWE